MPIDFEMLLVKMDDGFGKVYTKIDNLRDDFQEHIPVCRDRFARIDEWISVRSAVNNVRKCYDKEKMDWWKWIIRGTISAIALGAVTFFGMLATGGVRLTLLK